MNPSPLVGPADMPVTLRFTLAECNAIRSLVGAGPHDQVNAIIAGLEQQVQAALRAYHEARAEPAQAELPLVTDAA